MGTIIQSSSLGEQRNLPEVTDVCMREYVQTRYSMASMQRLGPHTQERPKELKDGAEQGEGTEVCRGVLGKQGAKVTRGVCCDLLLCVMDNRSSGRAEDSRHELLGGSSAALVGRTEP